MTVRRPEPAAIDFKGRRFLITDRPSDVNMTKYIQVCGKGSTFRFMLLLKFIFSLQAAGWLSQLLSFYCKK